MSTTTTVAQGSKWGIFINAGVYANWGTAEAPEGKKIDYHATYEMLGDNVVALFEKLAQDEGCPVSWIPYTSEVIADIDLDLSEIDLGELREQAEQKIRDQWENGDIDPIYE